MKKKQIISLVIILLVIALGLFIHSKNSGGIQGNTVEKVAASKQNNISIDTNLTKEEVEVANAVIANFNDFLKTNPRNIATIEKAVSLKKQFISMTEGKHHTTAYLNTIKNVIDVVPVYKFYCTTAMNSNKKDKIEFCYNYYKQIEDDNEYANATKESILQHLYVKLFILGKLNETEELTHYFISKFPNNDSVYYDLVELYKSKLDSHTDDNERGCYMKFLLDKSAALGSSDAVSWLNELPKADCSNYSFDEIFERISSKYSETKIVAKTPKIGFNK